MASILVLVIIIVFPFILYGGVYVINKCLLEYIEQQNALDKNFLKFFLLTIDKLILIIIFGNLFHHLSEYFIDNFYFQDIILIYFFIYPVALLGVYFSGYALAVTINQIYFSCFTNTKIHHSQKIFSLKLSVRMLTIVMLIVGGITAFSVYQNINKQPKIQKTYEYYENKKIKMIWFLKNNLYHGVSKRYSPDGILEEFVIFEEGVLQERRGFYPDGHLWVKIIYKNGGFIKRFDYDPDGNIINVEYNNTETEINNE